MKKAHNTADKFLTVNFHLTKACNMRCKYCHSQFHYTKGKKLVNLDEILRIIDLLVASERFDRVNFVGGEPLLLKDITKIIEYSYKSGLYVSIVTNGVFLTHNFLEKVAKNLRVIGISIDSLNKWTNWQIGRYFKNNGKITIPDKEFYLNKCQLVNRFRVPLKINTVVSRVNIDEDFSEFILNVRPIRWKLFQPLEIIGENSIQGFEITKQELLNFANRHIQYGISENIVVPESNDIMRGSYVMIDPMGRFFDSVSGFYNLSESILKVGVENALQQINFFQSRYLQRNGTYYQQIPLTMLTQ